MNKIVLDKTTQSDMRVCHTAIHLYHNYVLNMIQFENLQKWQLTYSILWLLNREIEKYWVQRERPEQKKWKLEPHSAYIIKDALMHLLSKSQFPLERAQATRLFQKVHAQLPATIDTDQYVIN